MQENYSLYKLNEFIRRFVALNLPQAVWVEAEIAEMNERRGHYYLSLIEKDADDGVLIAKGQAMMWAQQANKWQRKNKRLLYDFLREGRKVKLQVKVDFHEQFGLKFIIEDIDTAFTLGHLALDRQKTITSLKESGLWELNKMLTLKAVPQRLAIISSPLAAGLQDFLEHLHQNDYAYHFETQLFQAAMQGTQLSPEMRRQLKTINRRHEHFDAIVIIRGGGAKIDLAGFDDKDLCALAASVKLPIITGIGHDSDQSILDMVAHTSLKTPTAVADFFIQRLLFFEQNLLGYQEQVNELITAQINDASIELDRYEIFLRSASKILIDQQKWQLDQLQDQIPVLVKNQIKHAHIQLDHLEQQLQLLSLDSSLGRGFSMITQKGNIINKKVNLKLDKEINIHFKDGIQIVKHQKND